MTKLPTLSEARQAVIYNNRAEIEEDAESLRKRIAGMIMSASANYITDRMRTCDYCKEAIYAILTELTALGYVASYSAETDTLQISWDAVQTNANIERT